MWYVPESVKQHQAVAQAERQQVSEMLAVNYPGLELKAGYQGSRGRWKGVVKYRGEILCACECFHRNREQSTGVNGISAVDCAKQLISACVVLQFEVDAHGVPSRSIETAIRKLEAKKQNLGHLSA